jgi:hypothetical protein
MQPVLRYVSPAELRRRFNDGDYARRASLGEFDQVLRRDSHPTLADSTEPFCTRSQIVSYVDSRGTRVAVVHQYRRRDGSIGGSGQPDPKLLVEAGVAYRVLEEPVP